MVYLIKYFKIVISDSIKEQYKGKIFISFIFLVYYIILTFGNCLICYLLHILSCMLSIEITLSINVRHIYYYKECEIKIKLVNISVHN